VVEEITLTYTFIRADDDTRLVVPNEKLASDTIQNATIVERAQRAEITMQLPLSSDLEHVIRLLDGELADQREPEVFVSGLDDKATITVRALAADPSKAERLQHDLRLRAHRCLRAAGIHG
jgi:small-conductance mechanosensitive channel